MKPIAAALVLSATLLLGACGFHLRKGTRLPPDLGPLRIVSANRYSPLAEALSQALARSGAVPAPDAVEVQPPSGTAPPSDATTAPTPATKYATLTIAQERWGSRPAAIDARGRAQELTLRYAVEFNLVRADGRVLVPRQVVELARNYLTVPTQGIGTDSEQEILAKEMRRDMIATIMRRIDAALQATNPVESPPSSDGMPSPATGIHPSPTP